MSKRIGLTVNGEYREVEVEPQETLLQVLRNKLKLTGTKVGCGEGECGACTVLMDGMAVNSCLVLSVQADKRSIVTIEGIGGKDGLHPLQKAFIEHGAIQCGFCTPGMILAAKALLDENPHPSEREVAEAIAGHICRCTGFVKIIEAVMAVASSDVKRGEQ